eukprot:755106-Pleurochrysis_carterae.AAC.1
MVVVVMRTVTGLLMHADAGADGSNVQVCSAMSSGRGWMSSGRGWMSSVQLHAEGNAIEYRENMQMDQIERIEQKQAE